MSIGATRPSASTSAAPAERVDYGLEVRLKRSLRGFRLDADFRANCQRVVLFGPSGAGKSLTLKAIAGIFRPHSGRIVVAGTVLYDSSRRISLPPQARRVGYVPQRYALFPHLTVEENIGYGLHRLSREERRARVREVLALTGLQGLESRHPQELSGGQQQRVALARALAFLPRILLLDEPLSALDAPLRIELRNELLALSERTATALLFVTHDLGEAFSLAQHIVVMDQGRVLQQGAKDEVFNRPATRKVAELVGMRNILPARVIAASGSMVKLEWNGLQLEAVTSRPLHPGQSAEVCIRPTHIMIRRPEDTAFWERPNVLCGTIVEEGITTETYQLYVRVSGVTEESLLRIELPAYTYFRLGLDHRKEIEMSIRPELVHAIPAEA